jgi:hypothetical protein
MEPPQDLAQWACSLCDSTAAELSTPTRPRGRPRGVHPGRAHVDLTRWAGVAPGGPLTGCRRMPPSPKSPGSSSLLATGCVECPRIMSTDLDV